MKPLMIGQKKHNDDSKRLNKELATYIDETDDGIFMWLLII